MDTILGPIDLRYNTKKHPCFDLRIAPANGILKYSANLEPVTFGDLREFDPKPSQDVETDKKEENIPKILSLDEAHKLHVNMGHCSSARLAKLCNLAKVSLPSKKSLDDLIENCSCAGLRRLPTANKVNSKVYDTFNQAVGVDIFFVDRGPILLMVDYYSNLIRATPLLNRSSSSIFEAFALSWVYEFGSPETLICDQEGGLMSRDFERECSGMGVTLKTTAARAHFSLGKVERQVQSIKFAIWACRADHSDWSLEKVIKACAFALNSLPGPNGFTPFMLIYGKKSSPSVYCIPAHT